MLRFNTFRATRYLRTKFVEGKYLLASEASDLELEIIDLLRTMTKSAIGDVAIADAWQVSLLNTTQLLIAPGEAWFKGLPFINRFGKDELVSGATLSLGTVPVGVTSADDSTGKGKVITFNNGSTTPSNTYRLVITASEELITDVQDPFLQNVNLTEDTAQKIRLHFRLNIVPESLQSESPIPYADENSTSGSVTNFPSSGNFAAPNYVNRVIVTPTFGGNGELIATNIISGSQEIDGRSVELIVRNNPGLGGGNPLPNGSTAQQAFSNGFLIDSNGSVFYVNAIFNDVVNTQLVIRIDQEVNQPLPDIINTKPYTLVKRDVYVTDDVNGTPQGQLHWPIAKVVWDSTNQFVHESVVTDLRNTISEEDAFQINENEKFTLNSIGGGNISLGLDGGTLSWDAAFQLIGPSVSTQTINAGSSYLVDGGFLVYELNLNSVSTLGKGNLSVTTTTTGTNISLSGSPNLSQVSKGNILLVGSQAVTILSIDDVNKTLVVDSSLSSSGSGTIYRDSYASATYLTDDNTYVLAARSGSVVWVADKLALKAGQTGQLGVPTSAGISKVTAFDPVDTSLPSGTSATIDGYSVVDGDKVLFTNLGGSTLEYSQLSNNLDLGPFGPTPWLGASLASLPSSFSLNSVVFSLENNSGLASGTMVCAVYNDSSGTPGTLLGTSTSINISSVPTSPGDVTFNFTTSIPLTSGQKYYFIIETSGLVNGTDLTLWGVNPSSGGNTIEFSTNNGATWNNSASASVYLKLFGAAPSSGNNRVYEVTGVGTSLVWTAVGFFEGQLDPSVGDLVIFTKGSEFQNQIAEFNGSAFVINNPVRYFNGVDFWEQSALQTSTLNDNSSGNIFSVTALASENMVINFSLNRGGIKEVGTLWLTSDGVANAYLSTGGVSSSSTGVSFSASVSGTDLVLSYTTTSTGSSATMKYVVNRWSDNSGGPSGLPSYSPNTATIYAAAFVMSDNSGTPVNCNPTFNVLGKTRVQLNFSYMVGRNSGTTVGDLDIFVNGQRYPRFISGATLDGYYTEISANTIEFSADITVSPLSIEIIKKV